MKKIERHSRYIKIFAIIMIILFLLLGFAVMTGSPKIIHFVQWIQIP